MSNKLYRYKQLATDVKDPRTNRTLHVKSWPKPITLIRKRGNLTCEGCYFVNTQANQTIDRCALMLKSKQLPTCAPHYIFARVLTTGYEQRQAVKSYEKLKRKFNKEGLINENKA